MPITWEKQLISSAQQHMNWQVKIRYFWNLLILVQSYGSFLWKTKTRKIVLKHKKQELLTTYIDNNYYVYYIPTISKHYLHMIWLHMSNKKIIMMVQFLIFIDDCYSTTIFASSEWQ